MLQQSGRKQTFQSSAWQTTNIFYTFANIFYKSAVVPSCGQWVRNFTPVQSTENWMGKWESRWSREIQIMNMNLDRSGWSNPMVLASLVVMSIVFKNCKNMVTRVQGHHSMFLDHWSGYFCTLQHPSHHLFSVLWLHQFTIVKGFIEWKVLWHTVRQPVGCLSSTFYHFHTFCVSHGHCLDGFGASS